MEPRELLNALVNIDGMLLVLICTKTGRVKEYHINEEEFSKSQLGINASLFFKTAMEIAEHIGLQEPDYSLTHCPGYYMVTVNTGGNEGARLIFCVCQDDVEINIIFQTVNLFMNKT